MSQDYSFERRGRSAQAAVVVIGVYALLGVALIVLDLSLWIAGGVVVFTLPAIWDLKSNTRSGLTLTETGVSWFHGKRSATIERPDIKQFRIDLRMDRSVKLSVELVSGRKIRLPQPATPPLKDLERELTDRGFPYRKNPFALL